MNILVVDDEQIIVLGILKRLKQINNVSINCVGAYSGEEALQIMENFTPNLIITDLKMPNISGFDLIAQVKGKQICDKFIVLTAHEEFEFARQAVKYQVVDYLLKPVDWSILEKYVREMDLVPLALAKVEEVLGKYDDLFIKPNYEKMVPALKKIIHYIDAKFNCDISLTQLSIYTGMSENSICNLVKKELGITFLDYVYQMRLKKAMKILIEEPSKKVKDIAIQVGYHSDRQFFRLFKNKLNMTPEHFRKINSFN